MQARERAAETMELVREAMKIDFPELRDDDERPTKRITIQPTNLSPNPRGAEEKDN